MNIVILTPFYPPVISTLSNMVKELSIELSKRGHNVSIYTTMVEKRLSKSDKSQRINKKTNENGVNVIRVKSKYQFSSNFLLRGFYQLFFPYLFWFNIKKK